MTIKKRLFLSNLFMLLIPAMVSVLILAVSLLFFVNVVYKQVMDETVREENTVHLEHLLMEQAKEFVPWEQARRHLPANRYRNYPAVRQTVAFIWNRQK